MSLDVPAGAVTAVVGGDGAGKSTLLRCLVGRIVPAARSTSTGRPSGRSATCRSSSGTWRDLSVDENVAFVAGAYGAKPRPDLLERAGLAHVGSRLAGQLSGGMRHKLGFVLAMQHNPELLVLDEPSTGVDPVSRVELWRMIAGAAAGGTAVVMSTTYLDEAERASSLLVLDAGRAVLAGPPDEVVAQTPGRVVEVERPSDPRPGLAARTGVPRVAARRVAGGHARSRGRDHRRDAAMTRARRGRQRHARPSARSPQSPTLR